jgi:hypothetical protein
MQRHRNISLVILSISLFFLLASCSTPASSTPVPRLTAIPVSSTLPIPTLPSPTPTSTSAPVPPRAQYTMNVVLDYAAKSVAVDETIVYPNHTGQAQTNLVLAVEPNYWPGCFTLSALTLNNAPASYTLDAHKLTIQLPAVLAPEAIATVHVQYALKLPSIVPINQNSRPRIFGYSPNQINLTNWYPFVVPFMSGQWVLHDAWFYGEHLVYDAADYVVNIKSADPAVKLILATSGAPSQNGDWTTYTLTAGRTFAISASTEFKTASAQFGNVVVTSYYFPLYDESGQATLKTAVEALQIFSQRYGPYSHQTLAVVMGDFNDGMEFSAFFFLPHNAYDLYDGTNKNLLTTVTAHETAHQWFFEQVADDQAMQPWLDEAFAAYSEHIFYESVDPGLIPWWWAYWLPRVGGKDSLPWVDTNIYSAGGFIPYTNTVYLRGAHFLDDLRTRLGDPAFFAFLQDYLKQENGKIATAADFFRILRKDTTADFSDIVRQYFQNVY